MDLAVRCSRKAVKLNHSLTHSAYNDGFGVSTSGPRSTGQATHIYFGFSDWFPTIWRRMEIALHLFDISLLSPPTKSDGDIALVSVRPSKRPSIRSFTRWCFRASQGGRISDGPPHLLTFGDDASHSSFLFFFYFILFYFIFIDM